MKGIKIEFVKDFKLVDHNKTYPISMKEPEKILIHPCGFKIRESRYREIVNSQLTQDLERKWDQEAEKL